MRGTEKRVINPPGTEEIYKSWQFSQAVRVGDTVWISGQVGFDENMKVGDGIEEQTRYAIQNLKRVLEAAGGTLSDVVELVTYHTDINEIDGFAQAKNEFFTEDYPAHTAVGVTALVIPELLVEIRATAVVGSG